MALGYVWSILPALREVTLILHRLYLDDMLAALKQLDEKNGPPPRGDWPRGGLVSAGLTALLLTSRSVLSTDTLR